MKQIINNKRVRFLGLLLVMVFLTISCDDLVDEDPISEIPPSSFWQNNSDAALGVAGIYDGLQPTYRLKHYFWGEFRSDNFTYGSESASASNLEIVANDINSDNAGVTRWNDFYQVINRANLAIKYIPQIDNFETDLLAQAHAIRAYVYFDALRVWGGVPVFTEPTETSEQEILKPITDATTIMNEVVIPDMLRAEELSTQFASDFRFSKNSIWALQAEVYMWLKQYDNAKIAIENIIGTGNYNLVTGEEEWRDLFRNDNLDPDAPAPEKVQEGPELILSIAFDINEPRDNPGQTRANRNGIFALFFAGLPSYYLSPVLENKWIEKFPIDSAGWVNKYPNVNPVLEQEVFYLDENGIEQDSLAPVYGDWRYYFSREGGFEQIGTNPIGEARLGKYNTTLNFSQDLDDSNTVLYRYAGMLLLLAEAENQLGNTMRALELVNEIRTARQLPLVTEAEFGATIDEREDYILDERQLELLGEAQRWWDLRRTEKAIEVMNPILDTLPGGVPLTEQRLLFPIFDDHLLENSLIEQNPGY